MRPTHQFLQTDPPAQTQPSYIPVFGGDRKEGVYVLKDKPVVTQNNKGGQGMVIKSNITAQADYM